MPSTKKSPLGNLVIRTAVVVKPTLGYIYAADLKKEKKGIAHAIVFRWEKGKFKRFDDEYDAHSACIITNPEFAIVDISSAGYYSAVSKKTKVTEEIVEASGNVKEPKDDPHYLGFRSVAEIGGKAYAVGLSGRVYRLDDFKKWARIDHGLPKDFDIEAIHGFSGTDLYAAGIHGQLWCYDGKKWAEQILPTKENLNCVKCADSNIYIGGREGTLIIGSGSKWKLIAKDSLKDANTDTIEDLEWFEGKLYVSTTEKIYTYDEKKDILRPVDFGNDAPKSCYQLSRAPGVMWSNGEFDIMSFDGKKWTRVV